MQDRLDLNRRPSLHAAAFAVVEIRSFQERSDPRVTPSIEILSLNSSELESNDMSGRFLLTSLVSLSCILNFKKV